MSIVQLPSFRAWRMTTFPLKVFCPLLSKVVIWKEVETLSSVKDFEDFRKNWLSPEKEQELKKYALEQVGEVKTDLTTDKIITFSATYSLLLLAEYHEWLAE